MKSVVLYAIIGCSALAVGAGGGIIYKRVIMDPKEEIVGFNPDVCKPNLESLSKEVESYPNKKSAFSSMTPVDIANYSLEKYKSYENSVSYSTGVAKTVVNQEIRTAQIKVGNKYFEETISKSSMVGVGKRMYLENSDSDLKLYAEKSADSVKIDGDSVHTEYKTTPQTYTESQYKTAWGRTLPDMFIYCIHKMTIIEDKCSKEELPDGGYKVVLELDPKMGGYQYRYQMQTISDLDALPVFEFITLTFMLDSNFDLKTQLAHEKYKATLMGISPDIENNIEYNYFPNKQFKIPEINEDIDYASLKEGK